MKNKYSFSIKKCKNSLVFADLNELMRYPGKETWNNPLYFGVTLGVVDKWRHANFDNFDPLPPMSRFLVLRHLYFRHKILDTLPLRPRYHL